MNALKFPATFVAFVLVGMLAISTADAGLISIGTTTLSANGAEIDHSYSVLFAWNTNGNAAGTPTVNGIAFSNTQPSNIALSIQFNAPVTNSLLTEAHYTGDMPEIMGDMIGTIENPGSSAVATISDLTIGQFYRVQFLHHQDINASTRLMLVRWSLSPLVQGPAVQVGNNQGYITTVDFTADSTSQNFIFVAGSGNRAILNAAILQTVVPEPSTWTLSLIGLVGLGIVGWWRRKQASGTDMPCEV